MRELRRAAHTVYSLHYHFVFTTKYRKPVLVGEIGHSVRDLIREICRSEDIDILEGHVRPDHVHLLLSAPPHLAPSQDVLCEGRLPNQRPTAKEGHDAGQDDGPRDCKDDEKDGEWKQPTVVAAFENRSLKGPMPNVTPTRSQSTEGHVIRFSEPDSFATKSRREADVVMTSV